MRPALYGPDNTFYCDFRNQVVDCINQDHLVPLSYLSLACFAVGLVLSVVYFIQVILKKQTFVWFSAEGLFTASSLNVIRCVYFAFGVIHMSLLVTDSYPNQIVSEFLSALVIMTQFFTFGQLLASSWIASNTMASTLEFRFTQSTRFVAVVGWLMSLSSLIPVVMAAIAGYFHEIHNDRAETLTYEVTLSCLMALLAVYLLLQLMYSVPFVIQFKDKAKMAGSISSDVMVLYHRLTLNIFFHMGTVPGAEVICGLLAFSPLAYQNFNLADIMMMFVYTFLPLLSSCLLIVVIMNPVGTQKSEPSDQSPSCHSAASLKVMV